MICMFTSVSKAAPARANMGIGRYAEAIRREPIIGSIFQNAGASIRVDAKIWHSCGKRVHTEQSTQGMAHTGSI